MSTDALADLSAAGVSVWLDDLSRERLATGNLAGLLTRDHVVGVTTNPSIFQKALADGAAYAEQVADLAIRGVEVEEAVRALTTFDVRWACDELRAVAERTDGVDGRVSIEVDPRLARDTAATIAEAKALWWAVDRENLFIKIPATLEGLPAITACIAAGISVNVTLIFSLERYAAVLEAYLDGLEQAQAAGHDLSRIVSVASFFVSRVDAEVDARLEKLGSEDADALLGTAAIANARLAYGHFLEVSDSERWRTLAAAGARVQRPLWASTGVKNPAYDDTRYVVELVASDTVNTMPEGTLRAVADHGQVTGDTITPNIDAARQLLADLAAVGIDLDEVTALLEERGVAAFETSWEELLAGVRAALDEAR
ncbi:MAG: transaldolase [Nitriliruptoraceae bacterium]|nr:transaldolase [Nitriliruptoraceae bacterium]